MERKHSLIVLVVLVVLVAGIGWSVQALPSLPCVWPEVTYDPHDGTDLVSLTPTLQVAPTWPFGIVPPNPCSHDYTRWQIGTILTGSTPLDRGIDGIIYDSGDSTSRTSLIIPAFTLQPNTRYYWRVLFKSSNGADSGWYEPVSLTTGNCNWPMIFNDSPADGATGVSITPTLTATYLIQADGPCSHDATQWQIATDSGFSHIVYQLAEELVYLNSLPVPGGKLSNGTTYYWRARFGSFRGETSNWTATTRFTTVFGLAPPVFILPCFWTTMTNSAPADGATDVSLTPTLQITVATGFFANTCIHDKTDWQWALDPQFSNFANYSLDDAVHLTSLPVPEILSSATIYYWRVRFKSNQGDISDWTAPTRFTTALPTLPPGGGQCFWPNITNSAPADGATSVSLTPTLQITMVPPPLGSACAHNFTQWQIVTIGSGGGVTVVYDSGDNATNLTSLTVPAGKLTPGTTYGWNARLKSSPDRFSNWSTPTRFTTASGGPTNQAPTANFSFAPASPTINQSVQFTDQSTDPDGPADLATWSWNFGDATASTAQNPTHSYSSVGTFTVQLIVTDSIGQQNTISKSVTVGTVPSTGGDLRQFDTNHNGVIDDSEFFDIIDAWIAEQIGDPTFFQAVDLWIQQSPILAGSLRLDVVELLTRSTGNSVTFLARGQAVASMRVEIYDLNARKVFSSESSGIKLAWNWNTSDGKLVANGTYLYVVTVRGVNGEKLRSEIKKLLVLR